MNNDIHNQLTDVTEKIISGQVSVESLQELLVLLDGELETLKKDSPEKYLIVVEALNEFFTTVEAIEKQ